MNNYYVYVYLDPRKQGIYKYDNFEFNYEPFYVGKGKNNRCNRHLKIAQNNLRGKHPFIDKIQKLFLLNLEPIILKIITNLSNDESLTYEKDLISKIKLKCNGGTLLNLTNGGTGGDTFSNKTEEEKNEIRLKRSNSMSGKNKGKKMSEEQKEFLKKLYTGKKKPEHSKFMKGKKLSEETKLKIKNNPRKPILYKIIQLNKNDEIIKIWENQIDAAITLNFKNYHRIIRCCRNEFKTAYGYKWKYYEE